MDRFYQNNLKWPALLLQRGEVGYPQRIHGPGVPPPDVCVGVTVEMQKITQLK
jgi:hypothetical protein